MLTTGKKQKLKHPNWRRSSTNDNGETAEEPIPEAVRCTAKSGSKVQRPTPQETMIVGLQRCAKDGQELHEGDKFTKNCAYCWVFEFRLICPGPSLAVKAMKYRC